VLHKLPTYINQLSPIEIEVYKNDTMVKFANAGQPANEPPARGSIKQLSYKSRRRLAFTALNANADFTTMLTLTYPAVYPGTGKTVKRHLNAFLTALRRVFNPVKYLWFLEFQKRGAPHVHILIDHEIIEMEPCRIWASQTWYSIVDSQDKKHLGAGINWRRVTHKNGAAHYAVKYSMKPYQKWVPAGFQDVGRFWGTSRGVKPVKIGTLDIVGWTEQEIKDIYAGWEPINSLHNAVSIRYNSANIVLGNIDKLPDN